MQVMCTVHGEPVHHLDARELVVVLARTKGKGGTLSNVKHLTRCGIWVCDRCSAGTEYGYGDDRFTLHATINDTDPTTQEAML